MASRREFLIGAAALGAGLLTASSAEGLEKKVSPGKAGPRVKSREQKLAELRADLSSRGYNTSYFDDPRFEIYEDVIRIAGRTPRSKKPKKTFEEIEAEEEANREKNLWLKQEAISFYGFHEWLLADAEKKTGVSRFYVLGILGIETNFMHQVGRHLAFNALASMYLCPRDKMVTLGRQEIPELITFAESNSPTFTRAGNAGPDQYSGVFLPSSWAGAIGYAQFMPSSLNRTFVSAEEGKSPNPFHIQDCILSVGRYLEKAGWNHKRNDRRPGRDDTNWRAIKRYNNSSSYVRSVIWMAEYTRKNVPEPIMRVT